MNCGIVVREFVLQSRYYVHFRANTLGKGMNPLILPPAMGKQQDGLGSSALVRQIVQEKENSEFKPVKLRLKTDLASYPARAEGLVNSIVLENELDDRSSVLGRGSSHFTQCFYPKEMYTTVLSLALGKQQGRLSSLILVWQPVSEKENYEFKPAKLHFKLTLCCIMLVRRGS